MIAIIGEMNSGKSTLLSQIDSHGIKVVNCDALIEELYKYNKAGFKALVKRFGSEIITKDNNSISKSALKALILSDPNNLTIINELIHPIVINELTKLEPKTVVEITAISPLMLERFEKLFNAVIKVKPSFWRLKYYRFKNKNNYHKKVKKTLLKNNLLNIKHQKTLILKNNNKHSVDKAVKFIHDHFNELEKRIDVCVNKKI